MTDGAAGPLQESGPVAVLRDGRIIAWRSDQSVIAMHGRGGACHLKRPFELSEEDHIIDRGRFVLRLSSRGTSHAPPLIERPEQRPPGLSDITRDISLLYASNALVGLIF